MNMPCLMIKLYKRSLFQASFSLYVKGSCEAEARVPDVPSDVGKSNKEADGWATEGKRWDKGIFVWGEKEWEGEMKENTVSRKWTSLDTKICLVVKSSNL